MNRLLVTAALLAAFSATGCTSTDEASGRHLAETSPRGSARQPLILHGDGGTTCHGGSAATDLAYFDISWEATTDLDSLRFRLTNARGVRQLGGTLNVPPVNFGGRIDYSGQSTWAGHARALDTRMLSWPQHGAMWSWAPTKGETGLAVLHLRVDAHRATSDRGAGFDGVTAVYRTGDGVEGSTTIKDPNVFRRHC